MTLRMTTELFQLLDQTASHIDRDRSYIARATARRLERIGVIRLENTECITHSGPVYVSFRGVELPAGVDAATFRMALYLRCTNALGKLGAGKFTPAQVEGRDYVVVNGEGK